MEIDVHSSIHPTQPSLPLLPQGLVSDTLAGLNKTSSGTTKPSPMSDPAQRRFAQPMPHWPTKLAGLYKPSKNTNNRKTEPSQLPGAQQTSVPLQHPSTTLSLLNTTDGRETEAQHQFSIEMPQQAPPTKPPAPPLPPKRPSSYYLSG